MKRFLFTAAMFIVFCGTFTLTASAQNPTPNLTAGTLTRVTLLRIHPGKADEFWADMRKNLKPIYEAYKSAGIIESYAVSTKTTRDSEEDWDVALSLTYKNWGALDDLGAKMDPITLKAYGSAANRSAAGKKRTEHATQVASFLLRQQTLNDWK